MLIKSAEQITHISDKKEINSENYIESIAYIGNLYSIMNKLKLFLDIKKLSLEPTFKGKYTCSDRKSVV